LSFFGLLGVGDWSFAATSRVGEAGSSTVEDEGCGGAGAGVSCGGFGFGGVCGGCGFEGVRSGLGFFGCDDRFASGGGVEAAGGVVRTGCEANSAVLVVACGEGVSGLMCERATSAFTAILIRCIGRVLTTTERRATGLRGRAMCRALGAGAAAEPVPIEEVVAELDAVADPLALGAFAGSAAGVVGTATGAGACKTGFAAR